MKAISYLKERSGIYGLVNMIDGKIYVGKTNCLYRRCQQYLYDIKHRRRDHVNDYLLAAIDKYGISNFEFFTLEFCPERRLASRELHWMDELHSTNRDCGYNLRRDSSSGMLAHADTKKKISKNLRKQWADGIRSAHSEKLRQAWKNNKLWHTSQAKVMRGVLTKYTYDVYLPKGTRFAISYSELKRMKMTSVISSFHQKRKDDVICNGIRVVRKKLAANG